jgi:hypothetical protein
MKHTIEISTVESLLIIDLLEEPKIQVSLQNENDRQMARRLRDRIRKEVMTELSKQHEF